MTLPERSLRVPTDPPYRPKAIVIGAGLGGLSAAMRLGAKGYHVQVLDRLDRLGGRGSSISKNGFRFDLGPTILTVPKVFEQLWADCGGSFHDDVTLTPVDPYYEIRWPDGSHFQIRNTEQDMLAEVKRLFPNDLAGYNKFLKDCEKRYLFGFEGLGRKPMHRLWDLIKELPGFRGRASAGPAVHKNTGLAVGVTRLLEINRMAATHVQPVGAKGFNGGVQVFHR